MSGWQTVWDANFAQTRYIDTNLFPVRWGTDEFSFSSQGLTITSDGGHGGFLTSDKGAGNSYGYGKFQATFTMPTNQANGAYLCLWPSTNVWPGPEIDLAEQYNGKPYLTVHWKGSDGSNQFHSYYFNANLANPTTVAVVWSATGLSFSVNGQNVVNFNSGGSVPVPKDYADGGQNEAFGAGNVGPWGTKVSISDMNYSKWVVSASSASAVTTITSATVGNSGSWSSQFLYTKTGTDILQGGHGNDTFYVNVASPDGWAEINQWHSGDFVDFIGAKQGVSTISWANSADPNGHQGATASISLGGNGHIDSAVTFTGVDAATMQGKSMSSWVHDGVANLGLYV